jgi:hypothetical protein
MDPLIRGTDPGIRIHTKMSRIPIRRLTDPEHVVLKVFFVLIQGHDY